MSSETQALSLQPMHFPDAPAWFPLAWGWWAILAGGLITCLLIGLLIRWNKKRLAPKKTALRLLENGTRPSEAIELVRQAALCYFPREEIAQLTGEQWYQFLDDQLQKPRFSPNLSLWQQALYSNHAVANADELVQDCIAWVEQALPPKKRRS